MGSHLERYGAILNAVEINSSFYRPHRRATYERWATLVPDDFRFAVKVPKTITHERRLKDASDLLDRFVSEVSGLGHKLGPLLVQLPPSLSFQAGIADQFLRELRGRTEGSIVCEPRHASWFTPGVETLLNKLRIARVAADPPPASGADEPGGWRGLTYYRLHGSPRILLLRLQPGISRGHRDGNREGRRSGRRNLVHLRQHGGFCRDRRCAHDQKACAGPLRVSIVPQALRSPWGLHHLRDVPYESGTVIRLRNEPAVIRDLVGMRSHLLARQLRA